MFGKICVGLGVVGLVAFARADCDVPLCYLPYNLENSHKNKVVWITGASSGIGASMAENFVKAGATVIISARRVAQLEEVAKMCEQHGKRPMIVPLDVTDFDAQEKAYKEIVAKYGHIDNLILNAGRSQRSMAMSTSIKDTEDLMQLNFLSYVSLSKIVLPAMIERKQGHVTVTSSVSGHIGTPIGSSYSATKFALQGYFGALRAEVAQHGVRIMMVCPGPVESEITTKCIRDPSLPAPNEGTKMSAERCTHLILKGVYYGFNEIWIADQPILLTCYIASYMPAVSRFLFTRILGPARINALKTGQNVYDTKAALGVSRTGDNSGKNN